MGNFARKIIDAVQNTMLDRLFIRLTPCWGVALLWDGGRMSEITAGFVAVAALVLFIAWVLGALARLGPRKDRSALLRLHDMPENGFAVWGRPPEGGIRPPHPMRWLVRILGAPDSEPRPVWVGLLMFGLLLVLLILTWAVATKPAEFWREAPWLAIPSNRIAVLSGATVLVLALAIRDWASEQRALLEERAPPRPAPSRMADYGAFLIMAGAVALVAVIWWSAPVWIALGLIVAIALAGLIPLLPTKVMNFLFGERLQEPPSRG